jgi:nitroreductase/NAD-dependent dihydropyrimidine dehydrogenase PreA subunit
MSLLIINAEKCTKCNVCVLSCPVSIINLNAENKTPEVSKNKENLCIYCGHCESICPENALTHSLSQSALEAAIERNKLVNPTELAFYIKQRRSIRNFKKEPVEKNKIEQALDVVRYSPTGHNRQLNQWLVLYDTQKVELLTKATIEWMRKLITIKPEIAERWGFSVLVAKFDMGFDRICRNAPHIMFCYSPSSYLVGQLDAIIATTHLDLYLPSLGIGTCWAGYLNMAIQQSKEIKEIIGLDENSTVHTSLMIGYPKYNYHKIPNRKQIAVKWV